MRNEHTSEAKNLATTLIETLSTQGIVLKRTQALEVIAKLQNKSDWNRLSANLKCAGHASRIAKSVEAFVLSSRPRFGKSEAIGAVRIAANHPLTNTQQSLCTQTQPKGRQARLV